MAQHDPHHSSHTASDHADHQESVTDLAEHQRTFESFMRFWVWLAGGSIAVLVFLALFNS